MRTKFSAHALGAVILSDTPDPSTGDLYLRIGVEEQNLLKAVGSAPYSEETPVDSKTIRSRLGAKLDGGDCVEAFYRAVRAYQSKPDLSRRVLDRQKHVLDLAHLIIGNERTVDVD